MFIAFEGPDFSGKTTQVELRTKRLRVDHDVLSLKFPSGETLFGRAARDCFTDPGVIGALESISARARWSPKPV